MKSPLELRSSNVISQINVTPMVDVMLVLLIIFMVVTPAIVAGFQVQLPRGEHLRERPEYEQRVVLGIDAEGRYYLNKAPIAVLVCAACTDQTHSYWNGHWFTPPGLVSGWHSCSR